MKNTLNDRNKVGTLIILVFSLFYLRNAFDIPLQDFDIELGFTSRTLPLGLSFCAILLSTIMLFSPSKEDNNEDLLTTIRQFQWQRALILTVLMSFYAACFDYLGFILASALFIFFASLVLGERRLILSGVVSFGIILSIWLLLTQVFSLYLSAGDLYLMVVK